MWGLVILVVAVVAVSGAVMLLRRQRTPVTLAAFFRVTALAFMATCTALIGLFIMGETFGDPGGWRAAGLTALWLVPLAGLSLLAWYRPAWATAALAVLLAGIVALAGWYAADPAGWIAYENRHGPVRAVVLFILLLPAALAGWRRPLAGAVLLLAAGLAPVVIAAAAAHVAASFAAVSSPAVIGGLLYLLAVIADRRSRPAHPAHPGSARPAHP